MIVLLNNQRGLYGELVLSKEQVDFGKLPEWEGHVTRTVSVRNIGKKPITIHRIQTGCSYAEIEGPKVIQPETEATFRIILNPQLLPEEDDTTTTAIFLTDSPKTQELYLTITAKAIRFATLSAEVCDFGEILPETSHQMNIKLCVNAPLNQEEIRLLPPQKSILTWKLAPDSNSQCYIITIQLRIPKRDKLFDVESHPIQTEELLSSLLTIAFSNERSFTLPVIARIVESVIAEPTSLSYGVVNGKATPFLKFMLSSKTDFKVISIHTPKHLEVVDISNTEQPKPSIPQYQKWFKATWYVEDSPPLLREEIQITTSATSSRIRIPVYGFIQSSQP